MSEKKLIFIAKDVLYEIIVIHAFKISLPQS